MSLKKYIAFDFAVASLGTLLVTGYLVYHEIAKYTGWERPLNFSNEEIVVPFIILFAVIGLISGFISVILFRKKKR